LSRPLKYTVLREVEEVRHTVALLDGRVRWPRDITEACVLKLRKAGLVPAAIADELRLSDAYVERVLRRALVTESAAQ
jgi:hypothetical protein